jgi:competence protein ComEA
MDEFHEKLLPFIKEHGIALALGMAGLVCLGFGLLTMSQPQTADISSNPQPAIGRSSQVRTAVSPIVKQITIDIEGAVEKPGVYTMSANSRIQNALIAAGGLAQTADRQLVAQNLNLAAPLTDGAKLYIPAVGEQMMTSGNTSNSSSGTVQGTGTKLININQAGESDLDALPGVGPVTAQKIIDNRPYQSVGDLLDKKVVGQSVYTKIKDQVSVY